MKEKCEQCHIGNHSECLGIFTSHETGQAVLCTDHCGPARTCRDKAEVAIELWRQERANPKSYFNPGLR